MIEGSFMVASTYGCASTLILNTMYDHSGSDL